MFVILIYGCDIMKPNFRIVENSEFIEKEEFIKDYLGGMTYNELAKKYDINYVTVHNRIKSYDLPLRGNMRVPRNYSYNKSYNLYVVTHMIGGKNHYYGRYKTEEIAKQVVKRLREYDWDKSKLPDIKKELGL